MARVSRFFILFYSTFWYNSLIFTSKLLNLTLFPTSMLTGMYTIYNGPKKEKCVTYTRVAMMFSKKGKGKCTKKSTKVIPPGEKSLKMKILRSHFVAHCWKNYLNNNIMHLDPTDCGWKRVNDLLVPLWYEICNLPTQWAQESPRMFWERSQNARAIALVRS